MANIDLGDAPVGTPPTPTQQAQMRDALGAAAAAIEVTDNDAKLALTDLADGQQVEITDEGKRLERYIGDTAGLYTTVEVVGDASNFSNYAAGLYPWVASVSAFQHASGGANHLRIIHDGTRWQLWIAGVACFNAPTSNPAVNPADVWGSWTAAGGTEEGSVDAVNALPEATERNWHTLKNTVYLTVDESGDKDFEVNGVSVPQYSTTAVGWVPVGELILVDGSQNWQVDTINNDSSFQIENKTTGTSHLMTIGTDIMLVGDFPNGALVLLY